MSHGVDPAPERIVLVGFMASGKSTVGPRLAERLGWEFIDFDRRLHERTGRSPGALIRERGEAAFRTLEAELTAELAGIRSAVLAPGGGWVTRPELAERLGSGSVRVWLRVSPGEALRRAAAEGVDRPLLGPPEGRHERVAELMARREPLYAAADIAVRVDDRAPADIVEEILRRLRLDREEEDR